MHSNPFFSVLSISSSCTGKFDKEIQDICINIPFFLKVHGEYICTFSMNSRENTEFIYSTGIATVRDESVSCPMISNTCQPVRQILQLLYSKKNGNLDSSSGTVLSMSNKNLLKSTVFLFADWWLKCLLGKKYSGCSQAALDHVAHRVRCLE